MEAWTAIIVAFIGSQAFSLMIQELRDRRKERKTNPVLLVRGVVQDEIRPLSQKIDMLQADVEAMKAPVEFMGRAMPIVIKSQKSIIENGKEMGWNHTSDESLESLNDIIDSALTGAASPKTKRKKAAKAEGEIA